MMGRVESGLGDCRAMRERGPQDDLVGALHAKSWWYYL